MVVTPVSLLYQSTVAWSKSVPTNSTWVALTAPGPPEKMERVARAKTRAAAARDRAAQRAAVVADFGLGEAFVDAGEEGGELGVGDFGCACDGLDGLALGFEAGEVCGRIRAGQR